MKIKKHEMIYNLDVYAKTYASGNNLCLADVQGDYDGIDFGSEHSASVAFKAISKAYDEGITYIDFDEVDRRVPEETDRIRSAGHGVDRMRGYREAPSASGMSGFHIRNGSTLGVDEEHEEPSGFNLRFTINPDGQMEPVGDPTPVAPEEGPQDEAPEEDNASDEMVETVRRALAEESLGDSPIEVAPPEEDENVRLDAEHIWNRLYINPSGVTSLEADVYTRNIEQWQNEMNERFEELRFQNNELRNEVSLLQERLLSNTHDQVRMPEVGQAERENEVLRSILGNREE